MLHEKCSLGMYKNLYRWNRAATTKTRTWKKNSICFYLIPPVQRQSKWFRVCSRPHTDICRRLTGSPSWWPGLRCLCVSCPVTQRNRYEKNFWGFNKEEIDFGHTLYSVHLHKILYDAHNVKHLKFCNLQITTNFRLVSLVVTTPKGIVYTKTKILS